MSAAFGIVDLPVLIRRLAAFRPSFVSNRHFCPPCVGATFPIFLSMRTQGSFGREGGNFRRGDGRSGGRGFGGGGSGGSGGSGKPPTDAPQRRALINQTFDGELSEGTRVVMRDDTKVLMSVIKHIPQNGAITIKSLNAQLSPDVQEAVSEKHNGLKSFLEQRKQLFVVKANPSDGVLYVAATPLAYQKLTARERQRETMQEMLGLTRRGGRGRGGRPMNGGGGGFRGRNGAGGGRGGGGRGRGGGEDRGRNDRGGGGGFRGGRGNGGRDSGRMGRGEERGFGGQYRR
ncbi:hypothetical protein, conserved [Trypanosoma brucei gambiense DAL972]|uniref:Mitochondrial RNA binding complex 1 subunit n=1 Tax=Trypanosoma brucei gambiense (strain MHOM/CI/86/DAL972) TaxID=679716 RepID=C9ZK65_TRYB9|nr:hypothetical protein, conserved [Trypanosoma brucei gambiense DAL972]CBH09829.1 hypothetical protein, conserved [Trypanosoma brucei gambiense DAL972]|eukprot:XP_011772122.1 hypothetical protein, conserved [Trypanosoma brucei gambiense DAL972]